MKVKEIEYSKTLSIVANFNKIEFRSSMKADLEPGEDPKKAKRELKALVETELNKEISEASETLSALKD